MKKTLELQGIPSSNSNVFFHNGVNNVTQQNVKNLYTGKVVTVKVLLHVVEQTRLLVKLY